MTSLLSAQTYFDWIMPVLLNGGFIADILFNIITEGQSDIITEEKEGLERSIDNYNLLKNWDTEMVYNENMAVEIQSQLDYNYPYLSEQQLPVKVSVTEIKRLAAQKAEILSGDEDSIIDLSSYAVAPKARFMKDTSKITNTEKGTLYHLVMEHLPYSELNDSFDFEKFIESMCDSGYMEKEEALIINADKFKAFIKVVFAGVCARRR